MSLFSVQVKISDLLYNQCNANTCCYSIFICPTGRIRVCETGVSTGEKCGKPCLLCKNNIGYCSMIISGVWYVQFILLQIRNDVTAVLP